MMIMWCEGIKLTGQQLQLTKVCT